ncbi:MAG: hypothetical protein ACM3ZF_05450 [Mycobacterium leprae]
MATTDGGTDRRPRSENTSANTENTEFASNVASQNRFHIVEQVTLTFRLPQRHRPPRKNPCNYKDSRETIKEVWSTPRGEKTPPT